MTEIEQNICDVLADYDKLSTSELYTRFACDRSEFYKTLKGMEKRHIISRTSGVDSAGILGFIWTLEHAD